MAEAARLFVQEHRMLSLANLLDDGRLQSQLQLVN
jgi:hypothetical protein